MTVHYGQVIAMTFVFRILVTAELSAQPRWMDVSLLGPNGCRAIAVAPNGSVFVGQGGYIYDAKGVFRSTDHGVTWSFQGLSDAPIEGIAVASNGDIYAAEYSPPQIYRSSDNGDNWTPLNPPIASWIWGIVVNQVGSVFAATDEGMFRSTNRGETWDRVNVGIIDTVLQDVYVTQTGVLYARSYYNASIYTSSNNGDSWTNITPFSSRISAFATIEPSTLLAYSVDPSKILFRSTNNGQSWTMTDSALNGRSHIVMIANSSGKILVVTREGTLRYDGTHWQEVNSPPYGAEEFAMDSTNILYSAGALGVSVSTTFGNDWKCARGMNGAYVLSMASSPQGEVFAGTNSAAIFRTSDHGTTWSMLPYSQQVLSVQSLVLDKAGNFYAATYPGGILRSVNAGESWDSLFSAGSSVSYLSVALGDSGLILAMTTDGLFRSTNDGSTWSLAQATVSNGLLVTSGHTILMGDNNYGFVRRSTDRGATWTAASIDSRYGGVWSFTQIGTGVVLAGRHDGTIYRSTDEGLSWARQDSGGLPNAPVYYLCSLSNGTIFASLPSNGTFRSTDAGVHWEEWGAGIQDPLQVWSFTCDNAGYVYAGSAGVARSIQPLTSVPSIKASPHSVSLEQNYPNPFNPSTIIVFSLPARMRISLRLFNTLGQQVQDLFDGTVEPGEHRISLSAAGLPSGVYFCRLQTLDRVEVRKLVLVR